jgi:hypothetical protein
MLILTFIYNLHVDLWVTTYLRFKGLKHFSHPINFVWSQALNSKHSFAFWSFSLGLAFEILNCLSVPLRPLFHLFTKNTLAQFEEVGE